MNDMFCSLSIRRKVFEQEMTLKNVAIGLGGEPFSFINVNLSVLLYLFV